MKDAVKKSYGLTAMEVQGAIEDALRYCTYDELVHANRMLDSRMRRLAMDSSWAMIGLAYIAGRVEGQKLERARRRHH